MKIQRILRRRLALAGLSASLALAAPAFAGHGHAGPAYPFMHPHCHGGFGAWAV